VVRETGGSGPITGVGNESLLSRNANEKQDAEETLGTRVIAIFTSSWPHQQHGIWRRAKPECIGPIGETQSLSKLWGSGLLERRSMIKNASKNLSRGCAAVALLLP
jgi:hypothetical protein